jgi:hypothetical protein
VGFAVQPLSTSDVLRRYGGDAAELLLALALFAGWYHRRAWPRTSRSGGDGVSLAVWMGGVTHELDLLRRWRRGVADR